MLTRRRGLALGLAGFTGLALLAMALQAQRSTNSLLLSSTAVVQDFQFDPDTLNGWNRGPAQPVFFSHRRHVGAFEIDCLYCHTNTDRSPIAPMPSLDVCIGCHRIVKAASPEIEKLRGYLERDEAVPWERVYKLADFVQFNHARHLQAELECQECHGTVEEMDVIYQDAPLTMGWCLSCHRQRADEAKLAEAALIAEEFGSRGPESRGLYPKSIDSDYGVTKGPIDCVACHY